LPMSKDGQGTSRDRPARAEAATRSPTASRDRNADVADVVDLDVSWLVPADLYAVDALLRMQVTTLRCGRRLLLHGADGGLVELIELAGLGGVVRLCPCSGTCGWCGG
jgi:hypothetical protein